MTFHYRYTHHESGFSRCYSSLQGMYEDEKSPLISIAGTVKERADKVYNLRRHKKQNEGFPVTIDGGVIDKEPVWSAPDVRAQGN